MIIRDSDVQVLKKNGTRELFTPDKIRNAINKSASRANVVLSNENQDQVVNLVVEELDDRGLREVSVEKLHTIVEGALEVISPSTAKSYKDYRNFKAEFGKIMEDVYNDVEKIMYRGDKENANKDSSLVSTKKSLSSSSLYKEIYKETFLTDQERHMIVEGDYYIHDMSDRLTAMNCCLFRIGTVLKDGFEMANVWYNEPKTLKTAFDVISDVVLSAASQQYGGFTIPQVDKILSYYAEKSYKRYYDEYLELGLSPEKADSIAEQKIMEDYKQGFQGWEYKFNTVSSSRGDYPFITVTSGLDTSRWGQLGNKIMYQVHQKGQGKPGFEKPVLFPKYVFLYDKELHGPGKELYGVFEAGQACSQKTMYPDWLSLTGEGYVPSMYKQYKAVVSPMGCRAFLSPYYEKGGQSGPLDETDKPVFEGRFNSGAISLNLPLIYLRSIVDGKDFYEVLDDRLEQIRYLHQRTKDYLGNLYASTNPLAFTQEGFYGGNLKPNQRLKESKTLMDSTTFSFGITALDELQKAYNGRTLAEDGQFSLEVLKHINEKATQFKEEDHMLYAIYGAPAESLCFSGDTIVQTYGGNKKIKDITTKDLVYSFNETLKKIELKHVTNSLKTKTNAKVVKVVFDNGQEIICTPDHPFGVRVLERNEKGQIVKEKIEFIKACDLKANMRIKSNYIKTTTDGRPMCSNYYKGRHQLVQDINAEFFYGKKQKGFAVHHKDEDKFNNLFENLEYMTGKEHRLIHLKNTIQKFQFTSEDCGEKNNFYGKKHKKESNEKNRLAHLGKKIVVFSKNGEFLMSFECAEDARRANFTRNLVVKACNGMNGNAKTHMYKEMLWYYEKECPFLLDANHKIAHVEELLETIDVYDITVEDNHNFFVGGDDGILVHNCGKQIKQIRTFVAANVPALTSAGYEIERKGEDYVIPGVCDREYVSNSFHCNVREDISPIQKQDLENRFWNYCNGGKIQYVRYPLGYNHKAMDTLVTRAMDLGFYEGVNLSLSYCDDCGHQELDLGDTCPHCGSQNLTKVDRMNGYLAFSRVNGESRLNDAKMDEIKDRLSM